MGLTSWIPWLSEEVEKAKLILSLTKDEEQRKLLEELIADMEVKVNESDN